MQVVNTNSIEQIIYNATQHLRNRISALEERNRILEESLEEEIVRTNQAEKQVFECYEKNKKFGEDQQGYIDEIAELTETLTICFAKNKKFKQVEEELQARIEKYKDIIQNSRKSAFRPLGKENKPDKFKL